MANNWDMRRNNVICYMLVYSSLHGIDTSVIIMVSLGGKIHRNFQTTTDELAFTRQSCARMTKKPLWPRK
jgi:hypothetical protein